MRQVWVSAVLALAIGCGNDDPQDMAAVADAMDVSPVDVSPALDTAASDAPASTDKGRGADVIEAPDTPTPDDVNGPPACTKTDFTIATIKASTSLATEGGFLDLTAANNTELPADLLGIELLLDERLVGPFVFQGENYATCERCIRINAGCTADGCERIFLVYAGLLDIQKWDDPGGAFVAELTDIRAHEVTIAKELPLKSTPVENGQVWCIDSLKIDASPLELF